MANSSAETCLDLFFLFENGVLTQPTEITYRCSMSFRLRAKALGLSYNGYVVVDSVTCSGRHCLGALDLRLNSPKWHHLILPFAIHHCSNSWSDCLQIIRLDLYLVILKKEASIRFNH